MGRKCPEIRSLFRTSRNTYGFLGIRAKQRHPERPAAFVSPLGGGQEDCGRRFNLPNPDIRCHPPTTASIVHLVTVCATYLLKVSVFTPVLGISGLPPRAQL
jgi:hypothetical protein